MLTVIQRFVSTLLRLMLVCVGLVFAAFLLVAGLTFTLLLLVWSLLRGRRPRVVRFGVVPRSAFADMRAQPAARGEVVDIEAHEVPDTPQQLK